MSDDGKEKLSPEEGLQGINDLLHQVVESAGEGNLKGMDDILDRMGDIVSATGVDIPGLDDRLAMLKGQTSTAQHHIENTDAAMWVGDLARAQALNTGGVSLDHSALLADLEIVTDDIDEEYEEEEEMDASTLAEFLAGMGLEEPDPDEVLPDLYADIAAGTPGAIDAFVQSGEDPNLPRGEDQHTALLAALDAPGRNVEEIGKLLGAGANANVIHAYGDNALSWAAGYHHPDTVTAKSETALMVRLAAEGVDPNHVTEAGNWTVLHRAIIQGDAARVAAMLAAGADPTSPVLAEFMPEKLAHFTCAMLAAPKPDALQVLIDHGVDPKAPDGLGRTPADVIGAEAEAARARASEDDPWTIAHAEALETSLARFL